MSLDVSPSLVVYANPCKQKSHIEFARKKGVKLSTFDNEGELYKMKAIQPDAELLIRILPPLSEKAKVPLGNKYGCRVAEARSLLIKAKELDLNVIGVRYKHCSVILEMLIY